MLQSSGPITMAQVAAELGISASGLSLGDSRVRNLAKRPSGSISFADLYGKSPFSWVNSAIPIQAFFSGPSMSFMLTMQLNGAATWFDIPFKYFEGERPANIWVMFDIGWMYLSGDTNPLKANTWYQLSNGGPSTYYYRTAAEELSFNAYWTDNPAQGAKGRQALYLNHSGR